MLESMLLCMSSSGFLLKSYFPEWWRCLLKLVKAMATAGYKLSLQAAIAQPRMEMAAHCRRTPAATFPK